MIRSASMTDSGSVGPSSPEHNSLDLALDEAFAGQLEQPLQWVHKSLKEDSHRVMACYLAGYLLREISELQGAATAFRAAARYAVIEGSFSRAAAAVSELRQLSVPVEEELALIATAFSRGSAHVLDHGASPPDLVHARLSVCEAPLPVGHDELVKQVISAAEESLEQLSSSRWLDDLRVPRHVLFSTLDRAALRNLLEHLELRSIMTGMLIVEQGEPGLEMYILAQGEVEVSRTTRGDMTALARLGSGAIFGEMALVARSPRAAAVKAARPGLLLVLRKDAVDALVSTDPSLGTAIADYCRRRMIDNLIRTSAVLRSVNVGERPELVKRFVTQAFEAGQPLIVQGTEPDGLHLIASGSVAVLHRDGDESTLLATLEAGEVVGEMSLVLRRPASADVVALAPTVTLHLPSAQFLEIIRTYPGVLSHLYELAVHRDSETRDVLSSFAQEADDSVLF